MNFNIEYEQQEDGRWLAEVTRLPRALPMSNVKMVYFEEIDVLHLSVSGEPEVESVELSPNVTAELNEQRELIGIEIINASSYIRDSILQLAQASLSPVKRDKS